MAKKNDGMQRVGDILRNGPANLRPPTPTQMRMIDAAVEIKGKAPEVNKLQ